MEKITLLIEGMSCVSCSIGLEKALRDQRVIREASINFPAGKAYLSYDPEVISRDDILEAVKETGFEGFFEESLEDQAGPLAEAIFDDDSYVRGTHSPLF